MQSTDSAADQGGNTHDVSGVAGAQLKSYIERIERLMEEVKGLQDDIKDVYAEAKGTGFDAKVMKRIVALRKRALEERQEEEAILELYMQALGMLGPVNEIADEG